MAITVVPLQIRTLHGLGGLATISNFATVFIIGAVMLSFALEGQREDAVFSTGLRPGQSFREVFSNMSTFIFAFQGQSMFLEIMREMKRPQDFGKAAVGGYNFMFVLYLATTIIGYHYNGDKVQGFLPFSVPPGPLKTVIGVCLALDIVVGYLLTNQPLCSKLHQIYFPETFMEHGWRARLHWFGISGSFLVLAFVVANAIPFFTAFQSIIGSMMGAPICFLGPAFFYLRASALHGDKVPAIERAVCYLSICVLFPSCWALNLYSAVESLLDDWSTFGRPFDCILVGF
jgi:vesicular inhibitory amino acid transporter